MVSFRKLRLALIPALLMLAACGGGDDDDDSSGDNDVGADATSAANNGGGTRSTATSGGNKGSKAKVDVPTVRDGTFGEGSVHVEYSGGKDFKGDVEGNGIAQEGYTLLTFGDRDAAVILTFQHDSKDEPGTISITTNDLFTTAEWGSDCSVTVEDGDKELKGEFECDQVEGVEPGSTKSHKVRVKGNFSVPR